MTPQEAGVETFGPKGEPATPAPTPIYTLDSETTSSKKNAISGSLDSLKSTITHTATPLDGRPEPDDPTATTTDGTIPDPKIKISFAYLSEQVSIALDRGHRYESIIDGLIRGGEPIPPDDIRMWVQAKYTEAAEAAERERITAVKNEDKAIQDLKEGQAQEDATQKEARQILEHGDPLTYMIDTFNLEHVGDRDLAKCLVLSLASRLIENSKGLHVQVSGSSGKGKSDSYRTMLQQVPAEYKLEGSFSDKSLYYGDVQPRTVIFIDDKDMSDALREIMKESTSSFQKPIMHRTVNAKREKQVCTIAERCLWWSANVDTSGDDQELNRVLSCWVDDSKKQDQDVYQAAVERELRNDPPGEPRQVKVCRSMWTQIQAATATPVVISLSKFVELIGFASVRNRRDFEMFFDMIRSAAMINFFQRDPTPAENTIHVDATPEDFATAASVFKAIHGKSGSQGLHLTGTEKGMLEVIANAGKTEFTVKDIAGMTGLNYGVVSRMFTGRKRSNGTWDTGLLDSCPAIVLTDRSISIRERDDGKRDGNEIETVSNRAKWYGFDLSIYRDWTRENSGGVWLNPPESSETQLIHRSKLIPTDPNHMDQSGNEPENADPDLDGIYNTIFNRKNNRSMDLDTTHPVIDNLDTTKLSPGMCGGVIQKRGSVDQLNSKSDKITPIENQSAQKIDPLIHAFGSVVDQIQKIPATDPNTDQKLTDPTLELSHVRPGDYKKISDPLIQPCPVCGGRVCHYTEKTSSVKVRGPGTPTRHICRSCYEQARDMEQAAVQILPGAIQLTDLVHVQAHAGTIGMCSACGTDAATYTVPGTETAICQICYSKIAREQVDIR